MRSWNDSKKNKAHIELIPMIDVMMFLLVFFVLISLNVIPSQGMKTQLPGAASAQEIKPQKRAIVTLGESNRLELDGESVTLESLVTRLKAGQASTDPTAIILNSDKSVPVERLVAVMDSLRQGGFTSISIATRKL